MKRFTTTLMALAMVAMFALTAVGQSVSPTDIAEKRATAVSGANTCQNLAESAGGSIAECQSLIDSIEQLGYQLAYDGCIPSYEVPAAFYTTLQAHETRVGNAGGHANDGDDHFEEGENETDPQAQYDAYLDAVLDYNAARDDYLWVTSVNGGNINALIDDLEQELQDLEDIQANCGC